MSPLDAAVKAKHLRQRAGHFRDAGRPDRAARSERLAAYFQRLAVLADQT